MLHFHIWYFPFLVLIWFLGIDPGKENVEDTRKCDRSSGHNKRLWDRCPEIYNLFGNSWPGPLSLCNFFFYLFRACVWFSSIFVFTFFHLLSNTFLDRIWIFLWRDCQQTRPSPTSYGMPASSSYKMCLIKVMHLRGNSYWQIRCALSAAHTTFPV